MFVTKKAEPPSETANSLGALTAPVLVAPVLAGMAPLIDACIDGLNDEVYRMLLEGADAMEADHDRWTPLMAACLNGHTNIMQQLLAAGADPRAADRDGWTALCYASDGGHALATTVLLCNGASECINLRTHDGWVPLHFAAREGNVETLTALVAGGADVAIVTEEGWTGARSPPPARPASHLDRTDRPICSDLHAVHR